VEAAVYYVAAEGLTNIAKYAHATSATVELETINGEVVLHVGDNGRGGADPDRGTGLRGLADRVEALGGKLELNSPAGQGTTLTASIPCEPEPRPAPQVPVRSTTRGQQPRLA
jgi:signal transduction histidine kinase